MGYIIQGVKHNMNTYNLIPIPISSFTFSYFHIGQSIRCYISNYHVTNLTSKKDYKKCHNMYIYTIGIQQKTFKYLVL